MDSEVVPSRRVVLADATAALAEAGVADPRREALWIWSDLTGGSPADVLLGADGEVGSELCAALERAVRRRAAGEPLAYVTGQIEFRGLVLRSDRRALIPRPETEGLVDLLLARVRTGRAADIGTGTGSLALSLAAEGGFDRVTAVDVSRDTLALAHENRAALGASIHLVLGDLCEPLRPGSFDAIVSNPPYLTAGEYASLEPSVKQWEPAAALVSGAEGLEHTSRLLVEARTALRPGGWLALEVDCMRASAVAARAGALGWVDVATHADLFGRERYVVARRSTEP